MSKKTAIITVADLIAELSRQKIPMSTRLYQSQDPEGNDFFRVWSVDFDAPSDSAILFPDSDSKYEELTGEKH